MIGLTKYWLEPVIYLYPNQTHATESVKEGGTGFLVSVPFSATETEGRDWVHTFAVSNHHVINSAPVLRINAVEEGSRPITLNVDDWIPHPSGDDIAVAQIFVSDLEVKRRSIPISMFAREEDIEDDRISLGDDVFMIGRYSNSEGDGVNHPTVRHGMISQVGVSVHQKPRAHNQDSILAEMHSLPGYSGSPVFTYRSGSVGMSADGTERLVYMPQVASPIYLLGVDWGHQSHPQPIESNDRHLQNERRRGTYVQGQAGIALVVPAWKLAELLESEEVMEKREQLEALGVVHARKLEAEKALSDPPDR